MKTGHHGFGDSVHYLQLSKSTVSGDSTMASSVRQRVAAYKEIPLFKPKMV